MADPKTVRRRLERMRVARRDAMHDRLRRDVALQVLDETGSVTQEDIDRRMEAVWVEPDEATLGNMLAAKAVAAVALEDDEVALAREVVAGAEATRDKYRALADGADASVEEARRMLADAEARLAEHQELADVAASMGDASAAPVGRSVSARAGGAETTNGS